MKIPVLLFLLALAPPLTARAEITEQGTGMRYGANHAFFVTAPKRWVLDNESGAKPGMGVKFLRIGDSERKLVKEYVRQELMEGISPE